MKVVVEFEFTLEQRHIIANQHIGDLGEKAPATAAECHDWIKSLVFGTIEFDREMLAEREPLITS